MNEAGIVEDSTKNEEKELEDLPLHALLPEDIDEQLPIHNTQDK